MLRDGADRGLTLTPVNRRFAGRPLFRRGSAVQAFCRQAKPWRKAEFTSAAQMKRRGFPQNQRFCGTGRYHRVLRDGADRGLIFGTGRAGESGDAPPAAGGASRFRGSGTIGGPNQGPGIVAPQRWATSPLRGGDVSRPRARVTFVSKQKSPKVGLGRCPKNPFCGLASLVASVGAALLGRRCSVLAWSIAGVRLSAFYYDGLQVR